MAKLAIIGGGKMGEALIGGLVHSGWAEPDEILVCEIHEERREFLGKEYGVGTTGDVAEAVKEAKTVLVRRLDRTCAELDVTGTLSGEDVIPGFSCPVAELFV